MHFWLWLKNTQSPRSVSLERAIDSFGTLVLHASPSLIQPRVRHTHARTHAHAHAHTYTHTLDHRLYLPLKTDAVRALNPPEKRVVDQRRERQVVVLLSAQSACVNVEDEAV